MPREFSGVPIIHPAHVAVLARSRSAAHASGGSPRGEQSRARRRSRRRRVGGDARGSTVPSAEVRVDALERGVCATPRSTRAVQLPVGHVREESRQPRGEVELAEQPTGAGISAYIRKLNVGRRTRLWIFHPIAFGGGRPTSCLVVNRPKERVLLRSVLVPAGGECSNSSLPSGRHLVGRERVQRRGSCGARRGGKALEASSDVSPRRRVVRDARFCRYAILWRRGAFPSCRPQRVAPLRFACPKHRRGGYAPPMVHPVIPTGEGGRQTDKMKFHLVRAPVGSSGRAVGKAARGGHRRDHRRRVRQDRSTSQISRLGWRRCPDP